MAWIGVMRYARLTGWSLVMLGVLGCGLELCEMAHWMKLGDAWDAGMWSWVARYGTLDEGW